MNDPIRSPENKNYFQPSLYGTNEKSRKKSKRGRSKKLQQTSLIHNKDYKCVYDEDNPPSFCNSTIENAKNSDEITENIKTIEIDVIKSNASSLWFSMPCLKQSFVDSQVILREVLKNYFIFLDFFK